MQKFSLGQVVATQGVAARIPAGEITSALSRHAYGDWGDVCEDDKKENDFSLEHGGRVLSVYRTKDHVKFWILTEADNSVTTVLLPEEY